MIDMNTFNRIAQSVYQSINSRISAEPEQDTEWQRVNSLLADALKDVHVLYAKLARLQADFKDNEQKALATISENVLTIGGKLSEFSKAFYEGHLSMSDAAPEGPSTGFSDSMEFSSPSEEPMGEGAPSEEQLEVDFDYESGGSEGQGLEEEEDSEESDQGSEEEEEPEDEDESEEDKK